ncbi:MAG: hypothetical protein ABI567_08130 [Gammaproteobacteria bacterium]
MGKDTKAPPPRTGWRDTHPGLLLRIANGGRCSPALLLAAVASAAWLAWMAIAGARLEELREVGAFLAGVMLLWALSRHDADLARLGGMVAAAGFLYLVLV